MNHEVMSPEHRLEQLIDRYPRLDLCRNEIWQAFTIIRDAYCQRKKLIIAGNGGSAVDSSHIVGELMKSFHFKRELEPELCDRLKSLYGVQGQDAANFLEGALPAVALPEMMALSTAFMNDSEAHGVFAQGVYGLGQEGDVFLGISTSGNSPNIIYACMVAHAIGMKVIGLTGQSGGKLKNLSDCLICVPSTETYEIQEYHLPIYHTLCAMLEAEFFGRGALLND